MVQASSDSQCYNATTVFIAFLSTPSHAHPKTRPPTPTMAPIEPDTSNSNFQPLFLFGSYLVVTGALTALVIRNVINRAYRALPPSQTTRHRQSKRQKHVQIFAALSVLSLAITSYYGYSSLSLSYRVWAHERGEVLPNGLWGPGGLIGGGDETVGLELGRWLKDTSLLLDHWEIIVEKSRRFWWSQQTLLGSTALSVFIGIEGTRELQMEICSTYSHCNRTETQYPTSLGFSDSRTTCICGVCTEPVLSRHPRHTNPTTRQRRIAYSSQTEDEEQRKVRSLSQSRQRSQEVDYNNRTRRPSLLAQNHQHRRPLSTL